MTTFRESQDAVAHVSSNILNMLLGHAYAYIRISMGTVNFKQYICICLCICITIYMCVCLYKPLYTNTQKQRIKTLCVFIHMYTGEWVCPVIH